MQDIGNQLERLRADNRRLRALCREAAKYIRRRHDGHPDEPLSVCDTCVLLEALEAAGEGEQ